MGRIPGHAVGINPFNAFKGTVLDTCGVLNRTQGLLDPLQADFAFALPLLVLLIRES